MRVIGAGFGRTGTLSLKAALEDLGFGPTYHMQEVMRRPSHVETWLRYARTGEADWDALFSDFGSGVDYPVSCVWEELASHFPDAKVVLTVRDPEHWWTSTATTIFRFRTAFPAWMLRTLPVTRNLVEMVDRLVWDGLFHGRFADHDHAVGIFERHIEHVRATCPPERLLVFDVADGWEPLCAFLDVPVPRHPFPHLNDTQATRRVVVSVRWGTRALPIAVALTAAGLAAQGRARRSRRRERLLQRVDRRSRRPSATARSVMSRFSAPTGTPAPRSRPSVRTPDVGSAGARTLREGSCRTGGHR